MVEQELRVTWMEERRKNEIISAAIELLLSCVAVSVPCLPFKKAGNRLIYEHGYSYRNQAFYNGEG